MKALQRYLILPVTVVLLIAIVNFGLLPTPGIHAFGELSQRSELFSEVYQQASPSVVAISVRTEAGGGNGSGFVIDHNGHIVTNAHVVDEAQQIIVDFLDGAIVEAELIGLDPASDIAVIRVEMPADQLHALPFGDSDSLLVGQTVLAIGNPFGRNWTLTSGIVSAVDRTMRGLNDFSIGGVIQTDASINPGNSGGPLINLDGEVIGVNSQIISGSRSSSGVGFAIPSNLAMRVAHTLIEQGEMSYSYIGIAGSPVSASVIDLLNLPIDTRGVVVEDIVEAGPAADTDLRELAEWRTRDGELVGLRVDIITALDDAPITDMNDLITYLARHTQPEQQVTLTVLRDGASEIKIPLTLGSR